MIDGIGPVSRTRNQGPENYNLRWISGGYPLDEMADICDVTDGIGKLRKTYKYLCALRVKKMSFFINTLFHA